MEDNFLLHTDTRPRRLPGRECGILGDWPRHGQRRIPSLRATHRPLSVRYVRCCDERDTNEYK